MIKIYYNVQVAMIIISTLINSIAFLVRNFIKIVVNAMIRGNALNVIQINL